jgi:signal transduction histidine kinase
VPTPDVSLPDHIINKIHQHYQAADWCLITLDKNNQIIQFNSKAAKDLAIDDTGNDITDVFPLLATETLSEAFYLPFYNHEDQVFDVHFIPEKTFKYLVLVPVDIVHQQVQYKQQLAHNEEIEKLRFKALFKTLELAQKELIKANEAKSFYISALSHEMGNPLNAIKGYNQLLQESAIELKLATSIIDKNVKKLNTIINQAIDYDNRESHQDQLQFDLHEVVTELFTDFKLQAEQKNIHLINQIKAKTWIRSNKSKWIQILTNLISNGIKYTTTGGITLSAITNNKQLLVDVTDTGCGMSQSFQKNLFTAWSREYNSEAQGNGIGLVISKMLAEQVAAELVLLNSTPDGSTFRIISASAIQAKSLKVLLVDDDEDCLNLFQHYLNKNNHQVTVANSLKQLILLLNEHEFDAIITDLNLGEHQVTEAFAAIQAKIVNKVVMTANPSTQLITDLFKIGFDHVLAKPLKEIDLVNSIS